MELRRNRNFAHIKCYLQSRITNKTQQRLRVGTRKEDETDLEETEGVGEGGGSKAAAAATTQ